MVQDFSKYREHGPYHWSKTHAPWWRRNPRLDALYQFVVGSLERRISLEGKLRLDLGGGGGGSSYDGCIARRDTPRLADGPAK